MTSFTDHYLTAKRTTDCSVYDKALRDMLASATNPSEHNAAINLSINGKTPAVIQAIDLALGINKEK